MYYVYIYMTVPIIIGLPYVFIFYKASSYVMLMINEPPRCWMHGWKLPLGGRRRHVTDCDSDPWWWAKKQDSHGLILIAIILIDIE